MLSREGTAVERPIYSGLLSGAVAALVGSLVQLPLRAPSDSLFNSGTVMAGGLLVGLASGVIWKIAGRSQRRAYLFFPVWAAGFGITLVIAIAGESQLDRSISYIVPLAAIVFAVTGALTPLLASSLVSTRWWVVLLAVVAAVGVGVGLASMGDQESGRLELPPRTTTLIHEDAGSPVLAQAAIDPEEPGVLES